ncbi:MAG: hypothetical protein A4E54_02142 [Pelotomaculum sp. PtaB.Bin117]|nr:MAG: hypothetical protein A4E54_02142 [Pelotomaculum sp. PtaB.Bin117]OPY63369.1 MAG: hypothetical protein A4E56_00591 [Pelotomaculum sp. PtaU1.Bin065]
MSFVQLGGFCEILFLGVFVFFAMGIGRLPNNFVQLIALFILIIITWLVIQE